jgi:uncharacterized repeat protein (TIGR03803 family)
MRVKSLLLASVVLLAIAAQGQYRFQVLHAFGSGNDGGGLWSSVVFDNRGNLYGATSGGGTYGDGTVFQLSPQPNGEWTETILHSFPSTSADGVLPYGGVALDPSGNLYGTTRGGGGGLNKFGIVYELSSGPGGWSESVIHDFGNPGDPACCPWGNLIVDRGDNLYGTGSAAFELSRTFAGWSETVLHNFTGQNGDGYFPQAGPILDGAGNLYGTTLGGGGSPRCPTDYGCGTVYELQPSAEGVGTWRERILHRFGYAANDGFSPGLGQLAMDREGNIYGTAGGGDSDAGIVYKLTHIPSVLGGVWAETILYNLTGGAGGLYPTSGVIVNAGNLYGATIGGGATGCGVVYELTPQPDGSWQYALLHSFLGSDGCQPDANLTIGPDGNLYGTTATGGLGGAGVVFQIQIAPVSDWTKQNAFSH